MSFQGTKRDGIEAEELRLLKEILAEVKALRGSTSSKHSSGLPEALEQTLGSIMGTNGLGLPDAVMGLLSEAGPVLMDLAPELLSLLL